MRARQRVGVREPTAGYLPDAFVIDCSVCLPWYIEDEASEFCDRLAGAVAAATAVWVPSLWRAEFASALISAERRKRMTREKRNAVLEHAGGLPLHVDVELASLAELSEIADSHGLTPYDAVYFELALRRKLPLATLDGALVKAARAARLRVLTDVSLYPDE